MRPNDISSTAIRIQEMLYTKRILCSRRALLHRERLCDQLNADSSELSRRPAYGFSMVAAWCRPWTVDRDVGAEGAEAILGLPPGAAHYERRVHGFAFFAEPGPGSWLLDYDRSCGA